MKVVDLDEKIFSKRNVMDAAYFILANAIGFGIADTDSSNYTTEELIQESAKRLEALPKDSKDVIKIFMLAEESYTKAVFGSDATATDVAPVIKNSVDKLSRKNHPA